MTKHIFVASEYPMISATLQDVMGPSYQYYVLNSLDALRHDLGNVKEKPDLILMAGSVDDDVLRLVVQEFPEMNDVMVVMDMDSSPDAEVGYLGTVSVCPRTNNPASPFFQKARQILGE